jgi:hypothetical protein
VAFAADGVVVAGFPDGGVAVTGAVADGAADGGAIGGGDGCPVPGRAGADVEPGPLAARWGEDPLPEEARWINAMTSNTAPIAASQAVTRLSAALAVHGRLVDRRVTPATG